MLTCNDHDTIIMAQARELLHTSRGRCCRLTLASGGLMALHPMCRPGLQHRAERPVHQRGACGRVHLLPAHRVRLLPHSHWRREHGGERPVNPLHAALSSPGGNGTCPTRDAAPLHPCALLHASCCCSFASVRISVNAWFLPCCSAPACAALTLPTSVLTPCTLACFHVKPLHRCLFLF